LFKDVYLSVVATLLLPLSPHSPTPTLLNICENFTVGLVPGKLVYMDSNALPHIPSLSATQKGYFPQ
jgi:hypothetical protein